MTLKQARLVGITLCLTVVGGAATANAASRYDIDPAHSAVLFKVKNRNVSYVWGRFCKITGAIDVNILRSPSSFKFAIEVQSGSIDTNNKERDRELKGADFLNASAYRKITFHGQSTKRLEDKRFEVQGQLTLLGVTKDLTVVFELTGVEQITSTEFRLGGEATFTIKRSDFGMEHMIPDIADEITVIVSLEGVKILSPHG